VIRDRIIIISSDSRNTAIIPNILLIDVGLLEYDECVRIIEKVTWYKKIGIVENFEEISGNNFISLHSIIKPDHFFNHFGGGMIESPNYEIIQETSIEIFEYLVKGWSHTALMDKSVRYYRLWLDLSYNYKRYILEGIIKEIIE